MTRPASNGHARVQRSNIYDEITTKIIAELEAGRLPWVQPWGSSTVSAPLAMPRNAVTDRGYSGINVLILWGAVVQHGFATQGWLTFRQALGLGGNVRKGEHGTTVVYADRFIPDDERRRAQGNGDDPAAIPFLKRFTVFNVAQCEGLPDGLSAPPPIAPSCAPRARPPKRRTTSWPSRPVRRHGRRIGKRRDLARCAPARPGSRRVRGSRRTS